MINPLDIDNTNEEEIVDNLKKYHFSFVLKNILIIRSYSPLLDELIESIGIEFPDCVIDVLQVKDSAPYIDSRKRVNIYETKSEKGFLYRHLVAHYIQFEGKKYDAVFVLYGVDRDTSVNYNVDLYAVAVPSRYTVIYDINGKFRVITLPVLAIRTLFYLLSCVKFAVNVLFTFILIFLSFIFMLVFSPLCLFHKRKKQMIKVKDN